jgi:hypothetical protein
MGRLVETDIDPGYLVFLDYSSFHLEAYNTHGSLLYVWPLDIKTDRGYGAQVPLHRDYQARVLLDRAASDYGLRLVMAAPDGRVWFHPLSGSTRANAVSICLAACHTGGLMESVSFQMTRLPPPPLLHAPPLSQIH